MSKSSKKDPFEILARAAIAKDYKSPRAKAAAWQEIQKQLRKAARAKRAA